MKKFTNLLLIFTIIFNLFMPAGAAFSAAPLAEINITAPSEALRGQDVAISVSIKIAGNSNVWGIQTNFEYSSDFPEINSATIIENSTGWGQCGITKAKLLGGGEPLSADGKIDAKILFTVPNDAQYDTIYKISFKDLIIMDDMDALDPSLYNILNSSASIRVVPLPPVNGINIQEYKDTYDGQPHTIDVDIPSGADIEYSSDGDTYTREIPYFTDAGEYTVYCKVSKEGNSDTYKSGKVTIEKKQLEDSMIADISDMQYTGEQIKPDITVTDGSPSIITKNDYDISYGDNVNVKDGGSVTITGKGNYTGTAKATFKIKPITMTVDAKNYEDTYDGVAHGAEVNVTKPLNAQVKYGTTEGTYNLDTMPEYTDAGTYTVYYKATADNYEDYTGSVKVIITPKDLTDSMVDDIADYDYTGSKIEPVPVVSDTAPCVITDKDYTVSYGDNTNVATGGIVTVTGKGNYKGTIQKSFKINPIAMTVDTENYEGTYDGSEHSGVISVTTPNTATIKYGLTDGVYDKNELPKFKDKGEYTVYYEAKDPNYITNTGSIKIKINPKALELSMLKDIEDHDYTGDVIKPDITVTDGNPSIISSEDYDISYGENINVATGGSVTLTGKGNYTGSITKDFNIKPIAMTVSTEDFSGIYDGKLHGASVTVSKPINAEIKYGLSDGTYDQNEMPEFKDAGEYTVYYKATAENYIDNKGSVKVNITPKDLTNDMIEDIVALDYTGSKLTPPVVVSDGGSNLIIDKDYTVSYGDNVNVISGGTVTITGKGNYKGSVQKTFIINPIDMTVTSDGYTGIYDGNNHTISINVANPASYDIKYGLIEGAYTLSDAPEYKNAGEYNVYFKITADNYKDITGSQTVKISPKLLTEAMAENITAQEYTGEQIKPSVTLRDTLPCEITENDYTLSYGENLTVASDGYVVIEGKGNYTGSITKHFEIANAVLRTSETDYTGTYDGIAHKPEVSITNCDAASIVYGLSEGAYNLTEMPEFTNAGNYVVYYKASAENYSDCTGSLDVSIAQKALTDAMVESVSSHTYTANQITPSVTITDGDVSIISSADYDIVYGENLNVKDGGSVTVNAKRNYTGSVVKNFAITKAELSITSESKVITYGDAFTIPVNYSGFVGSDGVDELISSAATTAFPSVPNAGTYDIVLSGAKSDNYNITYGTGYTLTVNKKDVSIADIKVFDKNYDGTTDAVINEASASLTGLIAGDVLMLDFSDALAAFSSGEIGDGIEVTITGIKISGDEAENYNLTSDTFITYASIKASITASDIASQITSVTIDRNTTKLIMPNVPEGYVISLKSTSDDTVIDSSGNIYTSDIDKTVDLVFTVSSADNTENADTAVISVIVPKHDKYTISVSNTSGGSASGGGVFVKNTSATVTATASSGYKFTGWYNGSTLISSSTRYTFKVTADLSLTAKFEKEYTYTPSTGGGGGGAASEFSVKFVTNGGSEAKTITVKKNQTIGKLPTVTKEGYTFAGWYTDKNLTKAFDESSVITKSITLYAKWDKKTDEPQEKPEDTEEIKTPVFTDIKETDWYYDSVKYVAQKGLFKGITENEFAPNVSLTRAMLVTVLYRAENEPEISTNNKFGDVTDGEYYSKAVAWASENLIVTGMSENEFAPHSNITREQIATIIYRYAKYKGIDLIASGDNSEYNDSDKISSWASEAISFCKAMKIMTGNDKGEFMPLNDATRAEVAATLQRFFEAK